MPSFLHGANVVHGVPGRRERRLAGARLVNNLDTFPALMERESRAENTTKNKWIWGLSLTVKEALSEEEP